MRPGQSDAVDELEESFWMAKYGDLRVQRCLARARQTGTATPSSAANPQCSNTVGGLSSVMDTMLLFDKLFGAAHPPPDPRPHRD